MQKDKHNTYTKEELLKLIKEGKNAPADMDEFDLEALGGLKMLDNYDVLTHLNKDVDKIVITETKKEKQRKIIYFFSAAASLLLIVGLIFFLKNSDVIEGEKVVASTETKTKEDNLLQSLNAPVQEETPETYEAKGPEPATPTTTSEKIVLAENKTAQKPDKSLEQEKSFGAKLDGVAEDVALIDPDTKSGGTIDKKSFQQQTSKEINTITSAQPSVVTTDENRAQGSAKSNKVTVAMSQPSLAYQNKDRASFAEQSPAVPVDAKKAEEKAKTNLFDSNSTLKSDALKNYKEPSFMNGDSTFAAYVKQNLKISSTTNSGIIVVKFLVDKNGTATNIEVLKSVDNCGACSKDVIDFIKSIKIWKPAIQNGNAISAPKKLSIQYN